LHALFEAYNAATEGDLIDVEIETRALKRAELELEVARVQRGLPAR
jgi:hypothetical protein